MLESFTSNTNSLNNSASSLLNPGVSQSAIEISSGLTDPLQQNNHSVSSSSFSATTPGVFTVGETGKVSFDYLFDGGAYKGELAVFELDGLERYLQAGSEFFAREAALRALTNTDLGHIVISDQTESSRFNKASAYGGSKTFSMRPGGYFGIMLVPNGKIEDVLYNQNWKADQLPLFSMSLANPTQATQFAQLVDTHPDALNLVDGNIFSFEDLRLDGQSDRDYNDMIFQVRGITGAAPLIDTVIDPQHDWRSSVVGKQLMRYADVDGKGLTAFYYDNDDFTGYRGRRNDASVDFDWGDAAPSVMTSPDTFSIRWTGQIEAQYSEDYTFYTRSDEKVRLWVNGQLLIDHWTNHTLTENSGKIALQAGQKYDVKLEYAEDMGNASMQLLWSSPSHLKETVPQNVFYPDSSVLPLDPETGLEYRPEQLLVQLNADTTEEQIWDFAQNYGITSIERLVPQHLDNNSSLNQWRVLSFTPKSNLIKARDALRSFTGVRSVGFDYALELTASSPSISSKLWSLDNKGQDGGRVDADIDAPEAWALQKRKKPITVAVIDTGVDYMHPALQNSMWVNSRETLNGVDDDDNGYVDDIHGYDFGSNDSDPRDDGSDVKKTGHGTHVSGIIAADGMDGSDHILGVSPNAKIMALKIAEGQITFLRSAVQAIEYAVAEGAKVINASWSMPDNFWFNSGVSIGTRIVRGFTLGIIDPGSLEALADAIRHTNNAQVLFVAAAGNADENLDDHNRFPAGIDLPNVITVTSTDRNDNQTDNYSKTLVDLGAPGREIYSTVPGGGYNWKSGTSMAAPHVAGAAAVLLGENDFLSAVDLRQILMDSGDSGDSGDPLNSLKDKTVSGKRLNLANALKSLPSTSPGSPGSPKPTGQEIKLTINRIKGTDPHPFFQPSYYPVISMDGVNFTRYEDFKYSEQNDIRPQWVFKSPSPIPITKEGAHFEIQIWDATLDERVDINPGTGLSNLALYYRFDNGSINDIYGGQMFDPINSPPGGVLYPTNSQYHSVGAGNLNEDPYRGKPFGDSDEKAEIWFTVEVADV